MVIFSPTAVLPAHTQHSHRSANSRWLASCASGVISAGSMPRSAALSRSSPTGSGAREMMPDAQLASQRLFADRWLCCVWAGNTVVGDEMTMDAYLRLGHLVYPMGRGQPASIVDQHLERSRVPRRIEFTVESFLLAPFLLEGTDLVTVVPERAVP